MRKQFYWLSLLCATLLIHACQFKLSPTQEAEPADIVLIERYDRLQSRYLTTGDYAALQQMSTQYPTETRTLIEDILQIGEVDDPHINSRFLSFYQDTTLQAIISEVQTQYYDLADVNRTLTASFRRLRRLLPGIRQPRIYAQIGALNQSVVISDTVIGISLDKYLGADYEPYKNFYEPEQLRTMTRASIAPDCILFYLLSLYPVNAGEYASQEKRDRHMGRAMWVTNQVIGRQHFNTPHVKEAACYARSKLRPTIEMLLKSEE